VFLICKYHHKAVQTWLQKEEKRKEKKKKERRKEFMNKHI
jgi:hypothetical protein